MARDYYIASCVFTSRHPELGFKILEYVRKRFNFTVVRCCVPRYKLQSFTDKMPSTRRDAWAALPDSAAFAAGDTVYSLCHNCTAIIDETAPAVAARSLWELVLSDDSFPFPDYRGCVMTLQDCWRAREWRAEHDAVRRLLEKMRISVAELADNREKADFCGNSLFRPQPPRNAKLAPRHFVQATQGKFKPHTDEEQKAIMREYCGRFATKQVVAYCHYCVEGLELGGVDARHLASLLFEPESNAALA